MRFATAARPLSLILLLATTQGSLAGDGPFRLRGSTARRVYVTPTSATISGNAETPMLGSFFPTPVMTVRGNAPIGGGYSPLGGYGETSLSQYGPLSALRYQSAPVLTWSRGYDGRALPVEGTSFSTPNLPGASPVLYPTPFTPNSSSRFPVVPGAWPSAINWIDQN